MIALRGGERWVERFEPVPLSGTDERRLPWRERGVWLITGGLGGLGLVLAGELARSVRARLVLTGRGGLPPREEWPGWLAAHGESDATSRRIRGVQRLEELGAEVLVVAADVADEAAMGEAVRQARERFGPIQGAIHAAGLPGGGVIQLKTAEAAARVLAPKLQGTRALAAALAGEPLDVLVLCSSTFGVSRRRRPGRLLRGQQLPRRLRPLPVGPRHADGRDRLGGLAGGRHGGRGRGRRPREPGEPRRKASRRAGVPSPRRPGGAPSAARAARGESRTAG